MSDFILVLPLIYIVIGFGLAAIFAYGSSWRSAVGLPLLIIIFGWLPLILAAFILWIRDIVFGKDQENGGDDS